MSCLQANRGGVTQTGDLVLEVWTKMMLGEVRDENVELKEWLNEAICS